MKKILFLLSSLLFAQFGLLAQASGTVKGEVRDAENQALIGANIALLKVKDSTVVKIAITDLDGKFELENIKNGQYLLSISSIGLKKYFSNTLIINEKENNIVLPMIKMQSDATNLGAVTVTAQKRYIERKLDRTIINVDALISNAGATTWDVLGTSPGVRTDENGDIALKGKAGVMIFIDDKPTYLGGEALMNYLKSLPSGTIDKIELMTNPPAKYDAAGSSGVINIKTKKNHIRGFNGGFTLSYGQGRYSKSNNSLNLNYRNGKFNFFSNIGGNYNTGFNELNIRRNFFNPNGSPRGAFDQFSDIKRVNYGTNAKIGVDFYANKSTTFGAVLTGMLRPSSKTTFNTGNLFNEKGVADPILLADNKDNNQFKNGGLNLNFKQLIDTSGTELTIDADYIKYANKSDQLFKNQTLNAARVLQSADDLIGDLPSDIDIYTLKSDFTKPFKNGFKLETGVKLSQIRTNNVADYRTKINGVTKPNYDLSNTFIYKENISAAYLNTSKEWKKLSMQAGLRLENTLSKGHQLGNIQKPDSVFNRNYTNLFPTLYFGYKLDTLERHVIGVNYGKRINRPIFEDLNPFVSPLDKLTFYGGNPFLKPEFSHYIEFTHTYKGFLTTSLSYADTKNMFAETIEIVGINYFSRPGNIGQNITKSINVSTTFNPVKKWTATLYAEFTNQIYKGKIYTENLNVNANFGYISLNNQFQLGKGWSSEIGGFYQTNVPSAQLVLLSRGQLNAGVQKKILQNKGSLKFSMRDVFYSLINAGKINYIQNAEGSWTNRMDSRVATLSFSYNFSKGTQTKSNRKTGSAEEEKQRVKNQ
jgi:hypothetical protein